IVAVMSFSFSYLSVNFRKNDKEKQRSIIRGGIVTGFLAMVFSIAIALPLTALNIFDVHVVHLFMILFTILVSGAFISTAVYTKRFTTPRSWFVMLNPFRSNFPDGIF